MEAYIRIHTSMGGMKLRTAWKITTKEDDILKNMFQEMFLDKWNRKIQFHFQRDPFFGFLDNNHHVFRQKGNAPVRGHTWEEASVSFSDLEGPSWLGNVIKGAVWC